MLNFRSIAISLIIVSSGCSNTPPTASKNEESVVHDGREAFDVPIHAGFRVEERKGNFADFQLFDIKKGNTPYVGIYVGNHPSVDPDKPNGFYALLMTRHSWPTQIHVWIHPLPPKEALVAKRIASTISPR